MEVGNYVALSGQLALQRRLETVAHNVANASTPLRSVRASSVPRCGRPVAASSPSSSSASETGAHTSSMCTGGSRCNGSSTSPPHNSSPPERVDGYNRRVRSPPNGAVPADCRPDDGGVKHRRRRSCRSRDRLRAVGKVRTFRSEKMAYADRNMECRTTEAEWLEDPPGATAADGGGERRRMGAHRNARRPPANGGACPPRVLPAVRRSATLH